MKVFSYFNHFFNFPLNYIIIEIWLVQLQKVLKETQAKEKIEHWKCYCNNIQGKQGRVYLDTNIEVGNRS